MRRALACALVALTSILASPLLAPKLLAFPHHASVGGNEVYSTSPIPEAELRAVLERSDGLLEQSPIAWGNEPRSIYLTDGGWRWRWLALSSAGAFGLTRSYNESVILNRHDLARDRIFNGMPMAGVRSLSGVIAHEKCHGAVRRHFGIIRAASFPQLLVEGYCDHVAKESSLSPANAAKLEANGDFHPALPYYHGRKQVEAALEANGGSVDRLFADWP
jgi:hypothetical protein